MNTRNFEEWFATFRESISIYNYYTDFEKIYKNAEKLRIEINILNSLIGDKNIERDFGEILDKYPQCLKAIPILLAIRKSEIYCEDLAGSVNYNFKKLTQTKEQYKYFMRETGLFDMLQNHIINNLYDYVLGIEVGLDSNGRKGRGGDCMENLVEQYIIGAGVEYKKEMYLSAVEKEYNIDLSPISAQGTSTKRWDYVVKTDSCIYAIETNFYASNGSKLNETARSYKMIAEEAKEIPGFKFVWITDGNGWCSAKHNLKETFDVLENIYNINDMKNGALKRLFV